MTPPRPRASAPPTPDPETPDPQPAAPSPLFVQPATTDPAPDPQTPPAEGNGAPDFESGFAADEMPAAPSSSGPPSTIDRKGVQAAIEAGFHLLTNEANRTLARDDVEREAGLFLADDAEARNLAKPLSTIAVRHAPAGAASSPDLADAIAALLVLAGYLSRSLRLRRDLRRAKAEGRVFIHPDGGVQIVPPQPAPEQEPAA